MIKQVTVSTLATILTPSVQMKVGLIQNNDAANDVRLTFDGGSTFTDSYGRTGTDPTASTGYFLAHGKEVSVNTVWGDSGLHKPIRAIAITGSAVLDIVTDDAVST